jgi:hypothetical protein
LILPWWLRQLFTPTCQNLLCFAFIYLCDSILTTLWNKVHSNFEHAYSFSHMWFQIFFTFSVLFIFFQISS